MDTDYKAYMEYHEGLAKSNIDIQHEKRGKKGFFGLNQSELSVTTLKEFKTKNIMVMASLSASAPMKGTWHPLKYKGGFMILQAWKDRSDFDAEQAAMNETQHVGLQVIAKILEDISNDVCPKLFTTFKSEPVIMEMVAPVQGYIGWVFYYPLVSSTSITFDSEKWQ